MSECDAVVRLNNRDAVLPLVVIKGDNVNLLNRNSFESLGIKVSVNAVQLKTQDLGKLLERLNIVFGGELGKFTCQQVKLHLDPTVLPIRFKA